MSDKITGENDKLGKCLQIYDKDNYFNIYFFKLRKKLLRNVNTPDKNGKVYTRSN